jgi:hypothetical protein
MIRVENIHKKEVLAPLTAEQQETWVVALRSGKYLQGKTYLKYQGVTVPQYKFCCLGVLREVVPEIMELTEACNTVLVTLQVTSTTEKYTFVGLNESTQKALAMMNDELNFDFNRIADAIESGESGVEDLGKLYLLTGKIQEGTKDGI